MLGYGETQVMQTTAKQMVIDIQNNIKRKPVGNYGTQAVNATGALANSVRVVFRENGFTIWAFSYIFSVEYGDSPAEVRADPPTIAEIIEWINAKPVQVYDDKSIAAELMINSMKEKGTSIYQHYHGQSTGIISDVVNEESLTELINSLWKRYVATTTSEILKQFDKIAV